MALVKLKELSPLPIHCTDVQAYLRLSDSGAEISRLDLALKAAVSAVEGYTGRSLTMQRWRMTFNAGFAFDQSDQGYLSGQKSRGSQGIVLPKSPFARLEGSPRIATEFSSHVLNGYRLDTSGRSARIHLFPYNLSRLGRMDQIEIIFDAGYDEETLPADIKQAVIMIAADLYDANLAANSQPVGASAFSEQVLLMLRPYQNLRLI